MSREKTESHAVVIGGSIAGLLSSWALADYFDRVTLIERDRFPDGPAFRKGAPQARHVHILLKRGQMTLERFFPGIEAELIDAGVPAVDWMADTKALSMRGWLPRFPSNLTGLSPSRDLLEWTIRRRIAGFGRVQFLQAHDVIGLLPDASNRGVAGVRVRMRDDEAHAIGEERDLAADFVVDASGRDSRLPQWLGMLGYPQPEETAINALLGYASRYYQHPPEGSVDWKVLLVPRMPPTMRRGGVVYSLEGDRWVVTLAGVGKDAPPTDEDGFLEYARSLASPAFYEAIKHAQPLTPIYGYRRTENRLRHYERLTRWPERLVAVGDAVCAFNPVYGQGMTVAALEAAALWGALNRQRKQEHADDLTGLAHRFQKALAKITATPWQMATGEDFRYPETEGKRPGRRAQIAHHYGDAARALAYEDRHIYQTFIEVAHLLKPPTALFQPRILAQVVGRAVSRQKSAAVL